VINFVCNNRDRQYIKYFISHITNCVLPLNVLQYVTTCGDNILDSIFTQSPVILAIQLVLGIAMCNTVNDTSYTGKKFHSLLDFIIM